MSTNEYYFYTYQSDYLYLNGKKCYIIRQLTSDECDIDDVGNMYEVQFEDGTVIDVFEDELQKTDGIITQSVPN